LVERMRSIRAPLGRIAGSSDIWCKRMFKIVLRPDEQVALQIVQAGLYPPSLPDHPMVLRLIALRMLVADERGNPTLTPLAEAALARRAGALH